MRHLVMMSTHMPTLATLESACVVGFTIWVLHREAVGASRSNRDVTKPCPTLSMAPDTPDGKAANIKLLALAGSHRPPSSMARGHNCAGGSGKSLPVHRFSWPLPYSVLAKIDTRIQSAVRLHVQSKPRKPKVLPPRILSQACLIV